MTERTRLLEESVPSLPTTDEQSAGDSELFLLRLGYREGRPVSVGGNKRILLNEPEVAWVVYSGHVEVFAVGVEDGRAGGARRHLFHADPGALLLGIEPRAGRVGLLASGAPGTRLLKIKRSNLARLGTSPEFASLVAALVEGWVDKLCAELRRDLPPREYEPLDAGQELLLDAGGVARSRRDVLWITPCAGSARLNGVPELELVQGRSLPLSPHSWVEAPGGVRLQAHATASVLADQTVWVSLDHLHARAIAYLVEEAKRRDQTERERLGQRTEANRARLEAASARLGSVLAPRADWSLSDLGARDPLLGACRLVGGALGISVDAPVTSSVGEDRLEAIARASRVRTRRVALRGSWWKGESGPLLGYRRDDDQPVALLPAAGAGYEVHDPVARAHTPVTPSVAATLRPFAHMLYRRFDDRPLAIRDLLTFGLRGSRRDGVTVVLASVAAGLLAALVPLATAIVFDLAVPGAFRTLLVQIAVALTVAAVASALLGMTREIAVLRLMSRMDGAIQAAVIDRLLELRTGFFRQYTAGDLAGRALGISAIRAVVARVGLSAVLSVLFSLFSFGTLFLLDARLALAASVPALLLVAAVLGAGYAELRCERRVGELVGRLTGLVLQLINGVPKLRVAAAEGRAYARWAEAFAQQRRVTYRADAVRNMLAVLIAVYPVLMAVLVFGVVALALQPRPSTGTFLAFMTALGQFVFATTGLTYAFTALVQAVPAYERARPILQAIPEVSASKADPGELSGAIDVDRVSFRYAAGGPLILADVSLRFQPGEFVALVGPSGSGKSTLLRLLLRFEVPESGAILYDGQDLATLDLRAVRRQIGSVLQSGRLLTGDIFSNIVGPASLLTVEHAWDAVRMAGLEEDIRQMPMGLQTVITESGGTLSGGQRQRLLIARAIVTRPRILLFDEATSALDNRTQAIVSRSLETLAATRVVIAHRLSTVVNADRIYVLHGGRVAESGTYRELMQRRGAFADLARRQTI